MQAGALLPLKRPASLSHGVAPQTSGRRESVAVSWRDERRSQDHRIALVGGGERMLVGR